MKTRIIKTRFYEDETVEELSMYAQYLFLYLLTCSYINISGIFEIGNKKIAFETKIPIEEIDEAKQELSDYGKVLFKDSWIFVVNAQKHNHYRNSQSNEEAYEKELKQIPQYVKDYFDSIIDSSVGSSLDSNYKSTIRNNKQEEDLGTLVDKSIF